MNYKLFSSSCLLAVSLVASVNSFAATFYKNSNLSGTAMDMPYGTQIRHNSEMPLASMVDNTSSIYVPSNECVIAAENANFDGWVGVYGPGSHNLSGKLHDSITSVTVENVPSGGCSFSNLPRLYQHSRTSDRFFPVPVNSVLGARLDDFNNEASAIVVPAGMCMDVYLYESYEGERNTYSAGTHYLNWWNDKISSAFAYYDTWGNGCTGATPPPVFKPEPTPLPSTVTVSAAGVTQPEALNRAYASMSAQYPEAVVTDESCHYTGLPGGVTGPPPWICTLTGEHN